jgi:NAD(P) transhydrogenase subunit alpha
VPGEVIKTDNQVTIIGYTDWASRLAGQSSQLYGTHVVHLFKLLTPQKDGQIDLNFDDEIIRSVTITRNGEVTFPPPAVKVAAAPVKKAEPPAEAVLEEPKKPGNPVKQAALLGVAAIVLIGILSFANAEFLNLMGVFVLAVVAGYYVVWNVTHALHTPLMSVTNAISGVIIVGAMLQLVVKDGPNGNVLALSDYGPIQWTMLGLAAVAVLIASINIFGGFRVTARMLAMFQKDK